LGDYGIDPDEPEAAAARIRASRLREALLAALEHWLRLSEDAEQKKKLNAVLLAAQPRDAFQARWVAAAVKADASTLVAMAREPEIERLSAATVIHFGRDLLDAKEYAAAERLLRAAQQRKPEDFWINHHLGMTLLSQGPARAEEAVGYLRVAVALRSDSPGVYNNLGNALMEKGDLDEAIRCYEAALRINTDYSQARFGYARALFRQGHIDESIAEYKKIIAVNKDFAEAHCNLGIALYQKGKLDQSVAELEEAIRLQASLPEAHHGLGMALYSMHRLEHARAEFEQALRFKEDFAAAHNGLGLVFRRQGRLSQAVAEYKEAIRLKNNYAEAHNNLGFALAQQGQLDEAIAEYQTAIRLKNNYILAQTNLRETLAAKEVEAKLLTGSSHPADAAERLRLAWLCQQPYKQLYVAAARFYADAFASDPSLAKDLQASHRYNAASAAALAGCCQGKDAEKLDDGERTHLRQQSIAWLRADLDAWRQLLEQGLENRRSVVRTHMQHWLADPDFAGVRGEKALANLPAEERPGWRQLWVDVEQLLAKAREQTNGKEKSQ
jgi:tetratricopeptide (TPR) repeat protein